MNGRNEAIGGLAGTGGTVLNSSNGTTSTLTLGGITNAGSSQTSQAPSSIMRAVANRSDRYHQGAGGNLRYVVGHEHLLGMTTITTGGLEFTKSATLPTSSAVTVASGATIGLAVGTGGFATTDLDTLFGSVTGTPVTLGSNTNVNVNGAAFIGIDPIAANLSYTLPAGGAHGLTKLGNNTLALATANSYTGGTNLVAGTLSVGNAGSLGWAL